MSKRFRHETAGTEFLGESQRWKAISEFKGTTNCFEKTFQNGLLDFALLVNG